MDMYMYVCDPCGINCLLFDAHRSLRTTALRVSFDGRRGVALQKVPIISGPAAAVEGGWRRRGGDHGLEGGILAATSTERGSRRDWAQLGCRGREWWHGRVFQW